MPRELMHKDRRDLDDAVFELLGEKDADRRSKLIDELYEVTTQYYRYQRTQDIQSMENRAGAARQRLSAQDLAASTWDCLEAAEKITLRDYMSTLPGKKTTVSIPEGKAKAFGAAHLFEPSSVEFTSQKQRIHVAYENPQQAELVALLAELSLHGNLELPADEKLCRQWHKSIKETVDEARKRLEKLAASRTGSGAIHEQISTIMMDWFIHGRTKT